MSKYSRQEILPEIGFEGQQKLSEARVLMIGAGGLGCPALQYLAGAGVGKIGIIDPDVVSILNLHRQILFSVDQVGELKVTAAKSKLVQLNPDTRIQTYPEALTVQNALEVINNYDVVIDGSDNFATKYLANDACLVAGKPLVHGSLSQWEGRLAVFAGSSSSCYRCLFQEAPQGMILNCAEAGILGALAGNIGTLQALEAVKLVVNNPELPPLLGKMFLFDAKTGSSRTLTIPKREGCVCNSPLIDLTQFTDYAPANCTHVKELVASDFIPDGRTMLLDVRSREEWAQERIAGAFPAPLEELEQIELPDSPNYVLYCSVGSRSLHAAHILLRRGFHNVAHIRGGLAAAKGKLPLENNPE